VDQNSEYRNLKAYYFAIRNYLAKRRAGCQCFFDGEIYGKLDRDRVVSSQLLSMPSHRWGGSFGFRNTASSWRTDRYHPAAVAGAAALRFPAAAFTALA
jgi:hypothetical protein